VAKGELDLSGFPPGTVKRSHRYVCLACIFDIFTKQLKLAPKTAFTVVRAHTPSVAELTGDAVTRPYFDSDEKFPRCPHCDATKGKLARFDVLRIEGSRATAAARKALLESLPKTAGHFEIVEEKASRKEFLFEWLDEMGRRYDFDQPQWLMDAARTYLEKREPKTDWAPVLEGLRQVRRSILHEDGWERVGTRLYLAPSLYDELLLMHYLLSRSHKSGGLTFEGRLTLADLLGRLRRSGYLRTHEISGEDNFEVLEKLIEELDPGGASMKMVYVVDRRDFLEKSKAVYTAKSKPRTR
jgi:hypothetical protein